MKDVKCAECGETFQVENDSRQNICPECCKPDWEKSCENCGAVPVHKVTGMCGPCTFGEAETINGNW